MTNEVQSGAEEKINGILWAGPRDTHEERLARYNISKHDIAILRKLATRAAEIADSPANLERKDAWYKLDSGKGHRPMVLTEIFAVVDKNAPVPDSALKCENLWARTIERQLLIDIYQFDVVRDDHVIEPYWNVNWHLSIGNLGVKVVQHTGENYGGMGGKKWDPPIKDLDRDIEKLHPFTYSVDRETTMAEKQYIEKIFGDILKVRIRSSFWWKMGLTKEAMLLIGLENLMINMITNPKGLNRLLKFLQDNNIKFVDWLEKEGLLSLNNENDYIGTGSIGYTHDLPQAGKKPSDPVTMKDMWLMLESQETVGVGPRQFGEIVFPYQLEVSKKFGKCYYGCCEPLHSRWHIVKQIPNLARVSVTPWADQEFLADALGKDYVFSRKPNPILVSTEQFSEEEIRADLQKTLNAAKNCRLEIIMKDVHTLNNEPDRLARWVELAREEIAKI